MTQRSLEPRVLLIAYGNPLRGDDGLAWQVSELLAGRFSPTELKIVCCHQLAPELADDLSCSDAVIFVDAASPESRFGIPGEIRVVEIHATESLQPVTHHFAPAALLAMAASLYGATPKSFLVTVTGQNFEHEEALSAAVKAALPAVASRIEALLGEIIATSHAGEARRS